MKIDQKENLCNTMRTDFMASLIGKYIGGRGKVKSILVKKGGRNKFLKYQFRVGGGKNWHLMDEAGMREVIRKFKLRKE